MVTFTHLSLIGSLLNCIVEGEDIPYDLERRASLAGINIEDLKLIWEDVDAKTSEENGGITGQSGTAYGYG